MSVYERKADIGTAQTAHEITTPTICMAVLFPNLKTAKALGHNHCFPADVAIDSASFCRIAECPLLAQSRHA
jgi:hypothetical protein